MDQLIEFAKYGEWGAIILLIAALVYVVKLLYKMASNHINHANEAFNHNTDALRGLTDIINELKNNLK